MKKFHPPMTTTPEGELPHDYHDVWQGELDGTDEAVIKAAQVTSEEKCTCLHTFELRGERQCKKHPKSGRGVEEIREEVAAHLQHLLTIAEGKEEIEQWNLHAANLIHAVTKTLHHQLQKAREEERERIEVIFKKHVPPHPLSLEDSVWLKRLLNKAFNHNQNV